MLRKLTLITFLIVAAAVVTKPITGFQTALAQVNTGSLRIMNALPGIGPVDVFLDEARVAYGLPPGEATPYIAVAAGRHALAVRPRSASAISAPIADILIDLSPNGSQTAVVYQRQYAMGNDPNPPPIDQSGAIFVINDDRSPIQLGRTRLTGVHLAFGTPQRISIGYPSGEALLYQLALEEPFGSIDIDARNYSLAAIDADSPTLSRLLLIGEQNLNANTLYTVILVSDVRPSGSENRVGALGTGVIPYFLTAPIDPPPDDGLRLRIVHAAHSTRVVDVYIDERLVIRNLNYKEFTEYLGLASYNHLITIRAFGDPPDSQPLARASLTITPDNRRQINWTMLLVNTNAIEPAQLQPPAGSTPQPNPPVLINTEGDNILIKMLPDNISETQRGAVRVRVLNAADGAPPLELFAPSFPAAGGSLSSGATPTPEPTLPPPGRLIAQAAVFAESPTEGDVPAGLYDELNFYPSASSTRLAGLINQQLVSGVVYTYVVVGSSLGNPPIEVIQLKDFGAGLAVNRNFTGTIIVQSANVRSRPDASSGRLTSLILNTEVEVIGRNVDGQWIYIRYVNAETSKLEEGWISATNNLIRVERLGIAIGVSSLPLYTPPPQ
jgi:hypothetical protein